MGRGIDKTSKYWGNDIKWPPQKKEKIDVTWKGQEIICCFEQKCTRRAEMTAYYY